MSPEERLMILEQKISFLEHVASLQGGENDAYRAVIEGILRHVSTVPEVRATISALLEKATVSNIHDSTNASYSGAFDRVSDRIQKEMDFLIEPVGYKLKAGHQG